MFDDQIKHMVSRFLTWRLPEDFNPDAGINFKPDFNEHTAHPMKHEPTGTNLFDATQAEAMVRYLLDGLPAAPQSDQPAQGEPHRLQRLLDSKEECDCSDRYGTTIDFSCSCGKKSCKACMARHLIDIHVAAPASEPVAPSLNVSVPNHLETAVYCNRHPKEKMILGIYDRPGSPPGNGYMCQSCARERATPSSGADARELAGVITGLCMAWFDGAHSPSDNDKLFAEQNVAPLLESFRAETLEQAAQLAYDYAGTREDTEPSELRDMILALSPDPNWLARQITQAQIEEHGEQCDCTYENGEFHPCPRREELDRALSATNLESGEPQQQPEEIK